MTSTHSSSTGLVEELRQRAWPITLLVVFCGAVGLAASTFAPRQYRAEATITRDPPRVTTDWTAVVDSPAFNQRIRQIRNETLTRTRIERMVQDLDLYAEERKAQLMPEIVEAVRRQTGFERSDRAGEDVVHVSFTAADPRTAQRVTDRLSAYLIDSAELDRKSVLEGSHSLLQSEIEGTKSRLDAAEQVRTAARVRGQTETRSATLEFEALEDSYRNLLRRRELLQAAAAMERREIGEHFRMSEPARLPDRPLSPNRLAFGGIGAMTGLAIGLAMAVASATTRTRRRRMDDDIDALME